MKNLLTFIFFAVSLANASCQSIATDRTKNWQKDIDSLLSEIKSQHYVYKNKALPEALTKQANILKKNIPGYSDEQMLIELERLMYYLGDGHSYILPFGANIVQSHFLPLQLYEFSDGLFVVDAAENYAHLVGMKVIQAGDVVPEKFMQDMVHYISQDNTMGAKWIEPFFLRFRGMLESYGLKKNAADVEITFEDNKGKIFKEKVSFVPVPRMRGIPKLAASKSPEPLYLSNIQTNYWLQDLPGKKGLYFQFNQVMNDEKESLSDFSKRLEKDLAEKKPGLLIIDVRHNNGGNADLLPPLMEVLKNYERNIQGKIVIITGRNTFSAAQIFISKMNKETKAFFAGEQSSSAPNFVGEENMVVLPYSGAMGSISNRYHESNPGDNRKWIAVDLPVLISSKDYFDGKDPVLEAIFKHYDSGVSK
jgi:hypothetical protein